MDMHFDTSLIQGLHSPQQRIRVMTEDWMLRNGYCPVCGRSVLTKYRNNRPVADFFCEGCRADFELKSKEQSFGSRVADGAYHTAVERIQSLSNPHFFMLNYECDMVTDLCVVPNYFFTPTLIEPRKPLSPQARRAGWQGCNIRIGDVPDYGRIVLIRNGHVEEKDKVVAHFRHTLSLKTSDLDSRGWLLDVLRCTDRMPGTEFTLQQMYAFAPFLQERHPDNHHVDAKIRQQLQILREKGIIEFTQRGHYRKLIR